MLTLVPTVAKVRLEVPGSSVGVELRDVLIGQSAYQVWLAAGNTGTEADFVASLKGEKGDIGLRGTSAYQEWLALGNDGDEQDFIDSLKTPLQEPPEDGGTYVRRNGAWVQLYAPLIITGELEDGEEGEPYDGTLSISGGAPPYTLVGYSFIPGLTAAVVGSEIKVTGTPTEEWSGPGYFDVKDSLGAPTVRKVSTSSGGGGPTVYGLLGYWQRPSDTTAYLWRSYDTSVVTHEMWARTDDAGHFGCVRFRTWTGSIMTIGRLREGMIGTTVHHSAGSVVKTGTWTTSSNASSFGGSSAWSATAGDTMAQVAPGPVLGIRLTRTTNGGYATVAIDGDYTAATNLPAVTQSLIDAGKFTQDQLGHRYYSAYAASPGLDCHLLLTEGASEGNHTITVRAAGTAPAGSGNRAYCACFVGCTGEQQPGDSGTAMFYVRDVTGFFDATVSSMTQALEFAPTGQAKQEFVDNHGRETLDSYEWAVDGEPVTLTDNQIVSGTEITLARVVTLTHTVTGPVAEKTDLFSCRADRAITVQYAGASEWLVSGDLGFAYCGMLDHNVGTANGIRPNDFRAAVVGNAGFFDLAYDNGKKGQQRETMMAFCDPSHDTVAVVTVFDPEESLAGWEYAGPQYAFLHDRTESPKLYFARALGDAPASTEPITAGQITQGSCGWRVFRLPNAYERLKALFP